MIVVAHPDDELLGPLGPIRAVRWDADAFYDPDPLAPGRMTMKWGGFVPDVARFDADFFSIGSNDLTQYVTAAGRDIGAVADLADPLNPAVLRLITSVARHGRESGRGVSLCGDAGGEPRVIGALLRAGLRSLSVAPESVAAAKQAIAGTDLREATP